MKFIINFGFIIALLFSQSIWAEEKSAVSARNNYYRQQMILMSMYLYGINQELSKTLPGRDELNFLGDSIVEIVGRIRQTKEVDYQHADFDDLFDKAKILSKASTLQKARDSAHQVIDSCGRCHGKVGVIKP